MKYLFLSLILAATALAQNQPQALTVTIAASASVSSAVRVGGCSIANLEMDSAWTPAAVSFQGSSDGVTYKEIYDVAGALTFTPTASVIHPLDPSVFWAVRYVKIRSGLSGAAVNQSAARTLKLLCR